MKVYMKKIIVIILIILQIFHCHPIYAAEKITLENARLAIASYAINFYEKNPEAIYYLGKDNRCYITRDMAFLHKTKYKKGDAYVEDPNGVMYMDCVGWANFCVHNATGLNCGITDESYGNKAQFVAVGEFTSMSPYFDKVESKIPEAGDIISDTSKPHMMIFVGNGEIVHCSNSDYQVGLKRQVLAETSNVADCVYRLNQKGADEIKQLVTEGDMIASSSSNSQKFKVNGKEVNFYYSGIPDGKYTVSKSWLEIIIDNLAGIFDFIVGLLTMVIRMVFVGWTAIIENLLTFTMSSIAGGGNFETISVTSTDINSGDNITLEKIVFNEIGIFDVNFFNFNDKIIKQNQQNQSQQNQNQSQNQQNQSQQNQNQQIENEKSNGNSNSSSKTENDGNSKKSDEEASSSTSSSEESSGGTFTSSSGNVFSGSSKKF